VHPPPSMVLFAAAICGRQAALDDARSGAPLSYAGKGTSRSQGHAQQRKIRWPGDLHRCHQPHQAQESAHRHLLMWARQPPFLWYITFLDFGQPVWSVDSICNEFCKEFKGSTRAAS
jgi:hypothetical protein